MNKLTRNSLALAIGTILGTTSLPAHALHETVVGIESTFSGWFTLINPTGVTAISNPDVLEPPAYGFRTPITGTLSYDLDLGAGSLAITPFSFFGSGLLSNANSTFQNIGDGAGGPGSLLLGNMSFDWSGTTGIPVSIIWDAAGLLGSIHNSPLMGDIITDGALSATEAMAFDFGFFGTYTIPIGPAPLATTTFNTSDVGTISLGTNPSGTLPLTDDGVGGSPMIAGPFIGFNPNFDFTSLHVTSLYIASTGVPVPAAVWLFGSGLLGLIGVARRRKT